MTSHSYYVVMEDFGKRGLEAVVSPEATRRGIVSLIAGGNLRDIVFIHHVKDFSISDVTDELMEEAKALRELEPIDRQAARNDHNRDHAKNWGA